MIIDILVKISNYLTTHSNIFSHTALKLYGKDWKKVEKFIGTRSGAQIRSHA